MKFGMACGKCLMSYGAFLPIMGEVQIDLDFA